jgi:Glycine transporter
MATEFARLFAELNALTAIDLIAVAVAVFAITGALTASRKQLDIVGFVWLCVVTAAVGGIGWAFSLRALAISRGWSLTSCRARPGRTAEELERLS